MKKIFVCPVCKGKGKLFDHAFGVLTSGIGYLFQALDKDIREDCYRCKGEGFVKIDKEGE